MFCKDSLLESSFIYDSDELPLQHRDFVRKYRVFSIGNIGIIKLKPLVLSPTVDIAAHLPMCQCTKKKIVYIFISSVGRRDEHHPFPFASSMYMV